jgi:tRNA-binding protein
MATYEQFLEIEIRVGKVLRAESFPEARKPALKLWIDFGELGVRTSSAQITRRYGPEELVGRQVLAVTNFPARRIAGFASEVLVLGAVPAGPEEGEVILAALDAEVPAGTRIL